MTPINDGGPAFPQVEILPPGHYRTGPVPPTGMSLRDYLAAHAPPPPSGWTGTGDNENEKLVKLFTRTDNAIYAMLEWRWFYADAMLSHREKEQEAK